MLGSSWYRNVSSLTRTSTPKSRVPPGVESGYPSRVERLLLNCAYDSDEKFEKFHLSGATSYSDLLRMLPALAKGQELIFYCA